MNLNFNRKPMISGPANNISPLVSPRSKTNGLLSNLGGGNNGFSQTSSGFNHQDLSHNNNNIRPGMKNYQTNGYQNQNNFNNHNQPNLTPNTLLNLPKRNSQMQN
jgi:hypothetical protein